MHLSKRIIAVLCVITIVVSSVAPVFAYSALDSYDPVSFWEYVYKKNGFGGGTHGGDGFGGGGFGGSDPDSWTTSDDMKNDYNDYVSTLPASGYDSAGKLLWQPKWNDLKDSNFRFSSATYSKSISDGELSSFSFGGDAAFSFSVHNSHIGISLFESPSNLRGVFFSVNR